ncbi:MAG TPA: putative inorganic carbon transporter subunit DabA, partial [Gammaproteobacteria bacterium]|nr:putative inorganic carbon transporter subunit DabA [Gammaproteobacteria bacterium]
MKRQDPETLEVGAGGTGSDIDRAVDAVCDRIPPFWPLDAMVATNPYLGFADWDFDQAAEYRLRVLGRPMTMDRAWLAEQLDNGRIGDADLEEAAARMDSALEPSDIRAEARRPSPPATRYLLYSDLLDERYRPRYSRYVIQQISSFCAAYYDLGQAQWSMPRFGDSLYEAWLAYTRIDRTPGEMEIRTAGSLAKLPDSPRDAIRFVLDRFRVPADRVEDFLYLALTRVGGWASYLRHLRWEAEMAGGRNDDIVDLLAIRVAWEFILMDTCDRPARTYLWLQYLQNLPRSLRPDQGHALEVDGLLQRALEIGYQRRLVGALGAAPAASAAGAAAEGPLAQAAFCIDVRSEVFRRSLETVTGEIQTLGFAGFFGVPAEYQPLGAEQARAHLPVLLPAAYRVCETVSGSGSGAVEELAGQRRARLALSKAWKQFKLSAASCFSFVESTGLLYAVKLITDHLGLTRPVPHPETKGLSREQAASLGPDLDPGACRAGGEGAG